MFNNHKIAYVYFSTEEKSVSEIIKKKKENNASILLEK